VRVLNFKQAIKKAREIEERDRGVRGATGHKKTVGDVFEKYARSREVEGHDMTDSRRRFRLHIKPRWDKVPVERLSVESIRDWLQGLVAHFAEKRHGRPTPTEGTRATANRVYAVMRAALNHGLEYQGIPPKLAVWRSVKSLKNADGHREYVLSPAEIKRLINASDDELRPLVTATAYTGGRFGDVRELRARDFDESRKAIRLRGMKTRNKTTRRGYDVALSDEAVKFFKGLAAGRAPDDLIVTRFDGSQWGKSAYARQLAAANKRAKIKPAASLYTLRHSFATSLVEGDAPGHVIAKAMGHVDTRMVEAHYAHPSSEWQNEQVRAALPSIGLKHKSNVRSIDEPARRSSRRKS
jgi:integrase